MSRPRKENNAEYDYDDKDQLHDEVESDLDAKVDDCEACHETRKGRVYSFWAGYRSAGVGSLGDLREDPQSARKRGRLPTGALIALALGGVFGVLIFWRGSGTYSYRNVGQRHAFLCDGCIGKSWLLVCLLQAPVGLLFGIVLVPISLLSMMVKFRTGLVLLILSILITGLMSAFTFGFAIYGLATGPRSRTAKEQAAIRLMKGNYPRICNCFWTTEEYKVWRRGVY